MTTTTPSQAARLVFPEGGQPQGFASLATTQWVGSPEPVVRELLQNSLDARVNTSSRPCDVVFTVREVPRGEVPEIARYEEHFREAVAERERSPQGHAEKRIIETIEHALASDEMTLLYCCDNGSGLTLDKMARLLSEGNTDKAGSGAGAFGVGHLTAFAASDTRYVLYAGRSRNDHGDGSDQLAEVCSGHAILASRSVRDEDGVVIKGLAAHGHLSVRADDGRLGLFDPQFPNRAPSLLRSELDELDDTGTVVCITGFNRFHSETQSPLDAIARVSAKNFLVAIHRGDMEVRVRDETGPEHAECTVDAARLRELLRPLEREQRIRGGGGGWLPGEQAYRCVRTMEEGEGMELGCGAVARFRPLAASEGTATNVQLFRDGMWITNRADELYPGNFGGCNPFDAVVMIDEDEMEIKKLVREAEGPEHRGLDRARLGNPQRRRLRELLQEIQGELRERAGMVKETTEYTPDAFAVFGKQGSQLAETVPRYRPRRAPSDEEDPADATVLELGPDGDVIDPPHGPGNRKRSGRGASPQPGKAIRGRAAVVPVPNHDGAIDTLRVHWEPGSAAVSSDPVAVRARIPSGSDATCELPLPPEWLSLKELRHAEADQPVPASDQFEIMVPDRVREFRLTLATPITDADTVEVDFVRRKPTGDSSERPS